MLSQLMQICFFAYVGNKKLIFCVCISQLSYLNVENAARNPMVTPVILTRGLGTKM